MGRKPSTSKEILEKWQASLKEKTHKGALILDAFIQKVGLSGRLSIDGIRRVFHERNPDKKIDHLGSLTGNTSEKSKQGNTYAIRPFKYIKDRYEIHENIQHILKKINWVREKYSEKETEPITKKPFIPKSLRRQIEARRGQPEFRKNLLKAYKYKCAITGCDAEEALEAAHIVPYSEEENYDLENGLLLRADIHTLFDLRLINIKEKNSIFSVSLDPFLHGKIPYDTLDGKEIKLGENVDTHNFSINLKRRYNIDK